SSPFVVLVRTEANDNARAPARVDEEAFERIYRRLNGRLLATARRYVRPSDADDLVQDVWATAADRPANFAQSDSRILNWLIGIMKRCAPTYGTKRDRPRAVSIDALLAQEEGDDLEGRAMYEDVTELHAARSERGG
ncbi:MAG TPA: sigma-70 family RNA polymerase sigma factor, partial [Polyangiaceae bacterium]